MMKKYYFAVGNFAWIVLTVALFLSSGRSNGSGILNVLLFSSPLVYILFFHRSVSFGEKEVTITAGTRVEIIPYSNIISIEERKWKRHRIGFRASSQVIVFHSGDPIGIEHYKYTKKTAIEIVGKLNSCRNLDQE